MRKVLTSTPSPEDGDKILMDANVLPELDVTTRRLLEREEILTIEQLCGKGEWDLLDIDGISTKRVEQITRGLAAMGLQLKQTL